MIQAPVDFKKNKISSPLGLQIDNLVYNQHGELHSVRPNDFHRFSHPDMGGDYGIYSIPLSPEVLEKCGFKHHIIIDESHYVKSKVAFYHVGNDWYLSGSQECRKLHYLHQIQNLFYDLTGTELTYTPNH